MHNKIEYAEMWFKINAEVDTKFILNKMLCREQIMKQVNQKILDKVPLTNIFYPIIAQILTHLRS